MGNPEPGWWDRRNCRVGRAGAASTPGVVVCLDGSELVCDAPGHLLRVGEEVRLTTEGAEGQARFDATVMGVGALLPRESVDGVRLGFLRKFEQDPLQVEHGFSLAVVLPNGRCVSMIDAPCRVMHLAMYGMEFELPGDFPVVFPEGSSLEVRLSDAAGSTRVMARVARVVRGQRFLVYTVSFQGVRDRTDYHRIVSALSQII